MRSCHSRISKSRFVYLIKKKIDYQVREIRYTGLQETTSTRHKISQEQNRFLMTVTCDVLIYRQIRSEQSTIELSRELFIMKKIV